MFRLNKSRSQINPSAEPLPFIVKLFGSGFFSGYIPYASGTFGSLVGLAMYFIPSFEKVYVIVPAIVVFFIIGVDAATRMERVYGHDPASVVIDEIVGMWITLLMLPKDKWYVMLVAFFIFRAADIVKPPPAKKFDTMHGGFAIMMDDVIAGIYANLAMRLILYVPAP
jgi:phosphatidylglycerophosphatase A